MFVCYLNDNNEKIALPHNLRSAITSAHNHTRKHGRRMRIAKEWEKRYQRYHTRFWVWYRWYRFSHSIWFISMGYISHQYMLYMTYIINNEK